jgi:hypothetical protein
VADELSMDAFSQLKISEIELIEETLGDSIQNILRGGLGRAMHAMAWVRERRTNPDFSWEDAGDIVVNFTDSTPPTDASA